MCYDLDARPPYPPIMGGAADGEDIVLTAQDACDVFGRLAPHVGHIRSVRHERASVGHFAKRKHRRQSPVVGQAGGGVEGAVIFGFGQNDFFVQLFGTDEEFFGKAHKWSFFEGGGWGFRWGALD